MKKGKVKTWREFLNLVGGSKGLAKSLGVERISVLTWCASRRGIPEKHWPYIVHLFGISYEELFEVSEYLKKLPTTEKSK